MIDIFDIISYDCIDGHKLLPIPFRDGHIARLVLWLKYPNRSAKEGFLCFQAVSVTGIDFLVHGQNIENIEGMYHKIQEAKERILIAALPFIEDGCTEISGHLNGPWKNLMPGGD